MMTTYERRLLSLTDEFYGEGNQRLLHNTLTQACIIDSDPAYLVAFGRYVFSKFHLDDKQLPDHLLLLKAGTVRKQLEEISKNLGLVSERIKKYLESDITILRTVYYTGEGIGWKGAMKILK